MIHYTNALTGLIKDIVSRVEGLSFIDVSKLLVFARPGRTGAGGAYGTCHSLNLPTTEPGYYFWRDRATGKLTRRTECFVMKTPEVWMGPRRLDYLISFTIPRFCDQELDGSRKARYYRQSEPWIAKLDTVIHELYHIAPTDAGLRKFERRDGSTSSRNHGPTFFDEVAQFVRTYLQTRPSRQRIDFLRYDFDTLTTRFGDVVGTTFRNFPSYPQRYPEPVTPQPDLPPAAVVSLDHPAQPARYTEHDLQLRAFTRSGSRRIASSELDTAA